MFCVSNIKATYTGERWYECTVGEYMSEFCFGQAQCMLLQNM